MTKYRIRKDGDSYYPEYHTWFAANWLVIWPSWEPIFKASLHGFSDLDSAKEAIDEFCLRNQKMKKQKSKVVYTVTK